MKVHFEELEHRTRAMERPVAPGWLVTVVGLIWAFLLSAAAFNYGA